MENPNETIANEDVVAKYRASANAVNNALLKVAQEAVVPGKRVYDLCELGDRLLREGTAGYMKKKKSMMRGVAFPTSISLNNSLCHFSPDETDQTVIQEGDIVRIEMGGHIDGYIAVAATTIVATHNLGEQTLTGGPADAYAAAEKCVEAAMRLMKPGRKSTEITEAMGKIAEDFGVTLCEGVFSHQLKRFVIDGSNAFVQKKTVHDLVDEFEFAEHQVYSLDVCVTTGKDSRIRDSPQHTKPYLYKLNPQNNAAIGGIRRQSAKDVHKYIVDTFGTLPFAVRNLDNKAGRLGLLELHRLGLVEPLPVLVGRNGEFAARIKTTVWITSNNVNRATSGPLPRYVSEKAVVNEDIKKLLATSTKFKKTAVPVSDAMDMSDD